MPSSIDLSRRKELGLLAELVTTIRKAWPNNEPLLVGAMARDILLAYSHGIRITRATEDIDFAFAVESWDDFNALRSDLLATKDFMSVEGVPHRLLYKGKWRTDLIPFGGIESAGRVIAWKPNNGTEMHVIGYREAASDAVSVDLEGASRVQVVSLPALVLLKLFAWKDRRATAPGKDAADIWLILKNYMDAGNRDRLYVAAPHHLAEQDYDEDLSGAWLLGTDVRKLLESGGDDFALKTTLALVGPEVDQDGATRLARDIKGVSPQLAFDLLTAFFSGLSGKRLP